MTRDDPRRRIKIPETLETRLYARVRSVLIGPRTDSARSRRQGAGEAENDA